MKRFCALLLILLLLPLMAACGSSAASTQPTASPAAGQQEVPALSRYSVVFMDTFDTVISLIGYAESEEAFNAQAAVAHQLFVDLHKRFDCYNSYEDEGIVSVYTVNEKAPLGPVQVDPILYALLKFSRNHYELSKGQTNIALGSVLSIWHEYREAGLADPESAVLPPFELLSAASEHADINDLILDDEKLTVAFADPSLRLDVGAVAKGYAAEIVAKALLGGPMPSFIISAGGNVRMGEPPADGRANWGVGIQDPDGAVYGTSDIVETLYLHGCSVVTSGDYQRYYTVDGTNYCHLIDPDTLMPGTYFRSVSIITEDSGYADLLSTAAYLMPYEESRAFIESLPGVEALWLFADGSMEMTDGLRSAAKSQGATN
ncbi:MAG: FAD:protein FMN transferase [Clostridia bacterium]|nr:FAD:protein FMN transferase [Clostridia bacterium]